MLTYIYIYIYIYTYIEDNVLYMSCNICVCTSDVNETSLSRKLSSILISYLFKSVVFYIISIIDSEYNYFDFE